MWAAGFIWWYVIAIVAISGGYHRYYSHKSFGVPKWYPYAVNILGMFAGAGPALTWAATHRQHHAYSDTEDDPHSYTKRGKWAVYVNTWGYDAIIKRRFIKRYLADKILKFFYVNYFKLNVAIIVVFTLIDPMLMIFGYANILTVGEGWHENHHKRAADYRIGRKWWQFDPTASFIRMIKTD
jgi:stearoyl-CoA desaturase (delta-9 desaturase)